MGNDHGKDKKKDTKESASKPAPSKPVPEAESKAPEKAKTQERKKRFSIFSSIQSVSKSKVASKQLSVMSFRSVAHPLLDYSIPKMNVDDAIDKLRQMDCEIRSIYVVSRQLDVFGGRWNHWAMKIHCETSLFTFDFFEKSGFGDFGVHARNNIWEELHSFLYYFKRNPETDDFDPKEWDVICCILPEVKLDEYEKVAEIPTLLEDYIDTYGDYPEDRKIRLSEKCETIESLEDFMRDWHEKNPIYNAYTTNCQRFVFDMLLFMIDNKYYAKQLADLAKQLQSSSDLLREKHRWEMDSKEEEELIDKAKKNEKVHEECKEKTEKLFEEFQKQEEHDYLDVQFTQDARDASADRRKKSKR